jgi:hypothetical protein
VSESSSGMAEQLKSANFSFLAVHDVQLVRLGALAERYFKDDPVTCERRTSRGKGGICLMSRK